MLAAGAAERNHKVLEPPLAIGGDGGVDEGENRSQELLDGFLLSKIVDDWSILAGECPELLLAAGVRQAASIEDKSTAVTGRVSGRFTVERKAEDADGEGRRGGRGGLEFWRRNHGLEGVVESRKMDGQTDIFSKPAEVLEGVWDGLEKVRLALEESAEAVCAESLHDSHVDVGVIVFREGGTVDRYVGSQRVEIVVEKLLAKRGWKVGFAVVEERGDVVLESAFAAALVVEEERLAVANHDVAGLEVAVEKVVAGGGEKKTCEAAKVVFEGLFVEGDAGETEEVVLEVIEIPRNGLPVEAGAGIADFVVQVASGIDLETWKDGDGAAVGVNYRRRDGFAAAVCGEELIEGGVAEVFFEVGALGKVFGVNCGDRKPVVAEVTGELEEGEVFFADAGEDANGGVGARGEAENCAAGSAELALEGLHGIRR